MREYLRHDPTISVPTINRSCARHTSKRQQVSWAGSLAFDSEPAKRAERYKMTVAELIAFLQTQPQYLPVAYRCFSEQCLLNAEDISITEECLPRPDGWIQNKRNDMPMQPYLMLPGN
jgi:hypothetical protein